MTRNDQNGFTLIEIIIVLAVSTILMLGLMNLFDWHQKVYVQEQATVRTINSVRAALLVMSKNVAQSVTIESSHDFSGNVLTSAGSTLVLRIPSIDNSDAIIDSTYDYVAYYYDNGAVYQIIDADAGSVRKSGTKLLAESIQTFTLTYNSGPSSSSSVSVDIQSLISEKGKNYSTRVSDTFYLRNM